MIQNWGPLKQYSLEFLSETFATCLLILFGNLAVAQKKFTPREDRTEIGPHITYGIGVYVALTIGNPVSKAHINPAVSFALLALRKLNIIQFVFYILGQTFGAFLSSALLYAVYYGRFNLYDGGIRQADGLNGTGDIFYTVPAEGVSNWNCLVDSIIGTMVLMIFVMALGDDDNRIISYPVKPFAYVLLVIGFNFSMSLNCGNPINPARDFGPRLFAAIIYGSRVFSLNDYYFWVPLVGPLIGGVIGAYLFHFFVILTKNYRNKIDTPTNDGRNPIAYSHRENDLAGRSEGGGLEAF